jgi:DNA-binding CsgD family transcriptional regulator
LLQRDIPLIDRIYEAAVLPEFWPDVLIQFADIARARDSVLFATRGQEVTRWIASSPRFDELVQAFGRHAGALERTRRLLAARHPGFVQDQDVFTASEIETEPAFREVLAPRGYGTGIAATIFSPSGDTLVVHAEYAKGSGPAPPDLVKRLDRLRPHFARAVLLSARLAMQRVRAAVEALNMVGLPAAVLESGGRIAGCNSLFDVLIPSVVEDMRSRVRLVDQAADKLLSEALRCGGRGSPTQLTQSIPIRASHDHPPFVLHIVPVKGAAHDIFQGAMSILILTPVVPKKVPTANVLQGLFDLTPSEAKLAALVAAGHQIREAAGLLGVTQATARSTLKRIFAKVGVVRQAELVSLLQGTALP